MRLYEFIIKEGGNVFKDENKVPVTIRINKADVDPTLKWLEKIVGVDLVNNKLGSTGVTPTSGDLDVAIDDSKVSKDEMVAKLTAWAEKQGEEPKDWVRKSGINVHFKTPIKGNPKLGFVQTDLMFGNPEWQRFALQGAGEGSEFKGMHRHILMSSIAKYHGLKWAMNEGLKSRETNNLVTNDPAEIATILLGPEGKPEDFRSVEAMIERIQDLPEYNELVADARENFARDGLELPA